MEHLHGKKVFVYYNLHKNLWSIRHKGKVVAHAYRVVIDNPEFKVSQAGRQRVLKEKRKNVHAGVSDIFNAYSSPNTDKALRVSYNPYKSCHFYDIESHAPIYNAAIASMYIAHHPDSNGKLIPKTFVYVSTIGEKL